MSAGRYTKFQDINYWKAVIEILEIFPNAHYIVIGAELDKLSFLDNLLSNDLLKKIKFFGWQKDFIRYLGLADILIDTYPSGGGVVLLDAMALGIPVVAFKNNYLKIFDQVNWNPAQEFVSIPDLLVERGNFDLFKKVMIRLIKDDRYRQKLAVRCEELVKQNFGSPERMVKKCEDIYISVLENKISDIGTIKKKHDKLKKNIRHNIKRLFLNLLKKAGFKIINYLV